MLTTTTAIRQATAAALTSGERPFLVGGCCTVLPGALAAARDVLGRTAVAYLDGHLDLSDGVTSPTGEAADMPLSVALGRGPAAWVDVCGGATSRVEDVVPIGFRDPDEVPTLEQIAPELGPAFRPISKDEVQMLGPAAVGERVAADLASGAGRFWMHLDVDILGEDEFPATDYLMPDGLDMDELVALMWSGGLSRGTGARPLILQLAPGAAISVSGSTGSLRLGVTLDGAALTTPPGSPPRLAFGGTFGLDIAANGAHRPTVEIFAGLPGARPDAKPSISASRTRCACSSVRWPEATSASTPIHPASAAWPARRCRCCRSHSTKLPS